MPSATLCPSCGEFLPDGATACPRCRFQLVAAAPAHQQVSSNPYDVKVQRPVYDEKPSWQEIAFKIMAWVILIEGALSLTVGIIFLAKSQGTGGGTSIGHGALGLLVGVGLLLDWPVASLLLKITCWFTLAIGILLAAGALLMMGGTAAGWIIIGFDAVIMGIYGFMLYLVNEVGQDF